MLKRVSLGKKEVFPPFTFPSGIVTVSADLILRAAHDIGIGLVTAKSVGSTPREGYSEPIFSQYSIDSLSTAVGLSNPGVNAWIEEMKNCKFPKDKFLLVSIFSDNIDEFVDLACKVAPYCDGIELNFCCPHSLNYGAAVASEEELTAEITKAVRAAVGNFLVVKLTPDGPPIGQWAKKLVEVGAEAIAAIGPTKAVTVIDDHVGAAILSYGSGGLSGPAILETGIKCVKAIRQYVDVPIIGGGGIRGANDVRAYAEAGADIFAIGTSLAGLDTPSMKNYFQVLQQDLLDGTDNSAKMAFSGWKLKHTPMVVKSIKRQDDYAILTFDSELDAEPGQFVFAWIPGVGEKPFGVASCRPFTLGVRRVGKVSGALYDLEPGAEVMIRGPFGKSFPTVANAVIVAGGAGAVPLRLLAEKCVKPTILLGARTSGDLLFESDFRSFGETLVATDDGSLGTKGSVIDLLQSQLEAGKFKDSTFFTCGPETMIAAAAKLMSKYTDSAKIYLGLERYTSCGVGLCGKCALDGYRTCVDGPVMRLDQLDLDDGDFGKWHRNKCGTKEKI